MAFDENNFGAHADLGRAADSLFDVARFVARRDDDRAGVIAIETRQGLRSSNHEDGETEVFEDRSEPAIEEAFKERRFERPQNARVAFDYFPAREVQQVFDVPGGEPILRQSG